MKLHKFKDLCIKNILIKKVKEGVSGKERKPKRMEKKQDTCVQSNENDICGLFFVWLQSTEATGVISGNSASA